MIEQLSGRESRQVRDVLHQIANDIVGKVRSHDYECIAFENLKHIHKRAPPVQAFHEWVHRQLVDLVDYKADAEGICRKFGSPEYTSQRCPGCGHTSNNHHSQTEFNCESSGTTSTADHIAAKNVGWRLVRQGQHSYRQTGDRQLALKSKTRTLTKGFTPDDHHLR